VINHARTLLMNIDGDGYGGFPGDEYIPPAYHSLNLPGYVDQIRKYLFGPSPDRMLLNYRTRQYMSLLHSTELLEFLTDLDPRITYRVNQQDLFADQLYAPVYLPINCGNQQLFFVGEVGPPDVFGKMYHQWRVRVLTEEQDIIEPPLPTGGSWTLSIVGRTTAPILLRATADDVRSAIVAIMSPLLDENPGWLTVTNSPVWPNHGVKFTLGFAPEMQRWLGDYTQGTVSNQLVGDSHPTVTFRNTDPGEAFFYGDRQVIAFNNNGATSGEFTLEGAPGFPLSWDASWEELCEAAEVATGAAWGIQTNETLAEGYVEIARLAIGGPNIDVAIATDTTNGPTTVVTSRDGEDSRPGSWCYDEVVIDWDAALESTTKHGTVEIVRQTPPASETIVDYQITDGVSSLFPFPGSGLQGRFEAGLGAEWRVEALARPSLQLGQIEAALRQIGEPLMLSLFGIGQQRGSLEPFKTFYNLWNGHHLLPYSLGGLLLGVIYVSDLVRRGAL